jgi:hypothetical protein
MMTQGQFIPAVQDVGHQHVSPPNAASVQTVVQQGAEPPEGFFAPGHVTSPKVAEFVGEENGPVTYGPDGNPIK